AGHRSCAFVFDAWRQCHAPKGQTCCPDGSACFRRDADAKKPGFPGWRIITTFCQRVTRRTRTSCRMEPVEASLFRGCRLQIAEKLALGIKHQHIFLAGETIAVSLQATVEGVELRILPVSLSIDRRSLRITLTAQLLSLAEGLGKQHAALTVGVRPNTFGQLLTFRPMLARLTLTLGAHTLEYAAVHFARQIDAFDAHVHNLDAQLLLRRAVQAVGDGRHQLVTLARHRLMQSPL